MQKLKIKYSINYGVYTLLFLMLIVFSLHSYSFVKNNGQLVDQNGKVVEHVLYKYTNDFLSVYLNKTGFSYEIYGIESPSTSAIEDNEPQKINYNRCDVIFQDFNSDYTVHSFQEEKAGTIYKKGNAFPLHESKRIVYSGIYDHIDIEFILSDTGFKYNFILYPGADINDIQLLYDSPFQTQLNNESILIQATLGDIHESIPLSYLLRNGKNSPVKVDYKSIGQNQFGFSTNQKFLKTDTLIIDPVPNRNFGTYIGGSMEDFANAHCHDDDGNTYVVGQTRSENDIATTGAHQGTLDTFFDAYIIKYDTNGDKLWGTYFGGDAYDRGLAVAYRNGYLFLGGNTLSEGMATTGAYQETSIDGDEAYLACFDLSGQLIWSTYYGGELHDYIDGISFDSQNNIYVTGHTSSTFNISTPGAHLEIFSGISAAFLAKFDFSGNLVWGTYYGDSFDEGIDLAIDNNDNIYITGLTYSTAGISTPGVHQETNGGNVDAFLAKFNTDGVLQWGTYYGGTQNDIPNAISISPSNMIYITGNTRSGTNIYFNQGFQSTQASLNDGFVAKFNDQGSIVWASYVGGEDDDFIYGIDHFSNGDLILAGVSRSTTNISTSNAYQANFAGFYDAFMMKITSDGQKLWGTYYGGVDFDVANDVLIGSNQSSFSIVGNTTSTTNIASPGAHQETEGGSDDAFFVQFCDPILPVLNYGGDPELCYSNDVFISTDSTLFDAYEWSNGDTDYALDLSGISPGNYEFYVETIDTNGCIGRSDTLEIVAHPLTPLTLTANQNDYCEGDTVNLEVNDDYVTYSWSNGGTNNTISIANLTPGEYTYNVSTINDYGCTFSDTLTFNVYPSPQPLLNVSGSANFCLGETVEVNLNNNYSSYNWFDGSSSPSVILSSEELVWVEVTNSFGCSNTSDTVFINSDVFTPVVSMLNSLNPICEGDTIELVLNNAYDVYLWSNGSTDNSLTIDTDTLGVGNHYFYVEIANNCGGQATSDSIEIEVIEVIEPTVSSDFTNPVCLGDTVSFWVNESFDQFLWNDTYPDSLISIATFDLNLDDDYYFAIEVTNECGAVLKSDSILLNIVEPIQPQIELMNDPEVICLGTELNFQVNNSFSSAQWSTNENGASITITSTISGNDTIYVNTIDANGCLGYDEFYYTVDSCQLDLLENLNVVGQINLFPNPVLNGTTLYSENQELLNQISSMAIYDAKGSLVYVNKNIETQNYDLDLSHLEKGQYTIILSNSFAKTINSIKFIKL